MALSENIQQHLNWIAAAAGKNQLAALEVLNKETGEHAAALVIAFEREDDVELYPIGIIAEDISQFIDEWAVVGVDGDVETRISEDRTGLVAGDQVPSGPDTEV